MGKLVNKYLVPVLFTIWIVFLTATIAGAATLKQFYNHYKESSVAVLVYQNAYDNSVGSQGSGWFIDQQYLVTNAHVIGNSKYADVDDGKNIFEGFVIAKDSKYDIAIVHTPYMHRRPLKFGDSSKLQVADKVVNIGTPYGFFNSLGVGFVTGIGRETTLAPYLNIIQTSVGVGSGSSGSALLDKNGRVVGMIYSRIYDSDNLGFAIPINDIRDFIVDEITKHKKKVGTLDVR